MPLPVRERAGGGVVTHRKSCGESGFTLIQVVLATAVLTIAALSLTVVQISSLSLTASNRETAEARHVARQILEDLRSETVSEVYARYNSIPTDDPEGDGTGPGDTLTVPTDCGTMTASIEFPGNTGAVLREDAVDAELGMPRDLDGDGTVDTDDHAGDYLVLPVRVRVTWDGVSGSRSYTICTVLLCE
jgi:type II secretory pathway pseudopilin PulG